MRRSILALFLLAPVMGAHAQGGDLCRQAMQQATPVRPTMLAPVAIELRSASTQLGNGSGVLAQAFDEGLSVDNVLLRIKLDGCRSVANVAPAASVVDPNNPAAYVKRTEFDNSPWRFDMSQNGKRMTADEFAAWMKARGVRVAKGAAPAPVQAPAAPPAEPAK